MVGRVMAFVFLPTSSLGCGETFVIEDGGADGSVVPPDAEPPVPDAEPPLPDGGLCGFYPAASPAGWYYGVGPDCLDRQDVYYTSGAEPRLGSVMRLECPVIPSSSAWVGVGTPCTSDDRCAEAPTFFGATFPRGLVCAGGSCQPACEGDLDCPSGAPCVAGLCVPGC